MDVGRRRGGVRTGVAAGSIWESRMIIDEVKGGIKVFNGEENSEENGENQNGSKVQPRRLKPVLQTGKRKTWKSEGSDAIQIAKGGRPDLQKSCDEPGDGIKKSPIQRKTKSDGMIEKSPGQLRKARSEKGVVGETGDAKKSLIQLRKTKSESNKVSDQPDKDVVDGSERTIEKNQVGVKDARKSESDKGLDEPNKEDDVDGSEENIEKNSIDAKEEKKSEETCKEFGVCQEKIITTNLGNPGEMKSPPELKVNADADDEGDEEYEESTQEIKIENENMCSDIKEINIPEDEPEKSILDEEKTKIIQIREKPAPEPSNLNKLPPPSPSSKRTLDFHSPKKPSLPTPTKPSIVNLSRQSLPTIADLRKQSSHNLTNLRKPSFRKTTPVVEESHKVSESNSKLQNLVDLVMWRDVSKSTLVFGIGTFMMLSSSYTEDLNISFISVMSYLGLLYLAAIFLYKSIICRGAIDTYDSSQYYVVGEEEAIWLIKLFLPYMNEFLLKLRNLFSGDPATTVNLAVLLFLLARSGGSITIWKMVKLGFFGAFTVPKVYSLYSTQITGYGQFWVRRFEDAWESCSHKKAIAGALFTVVWNLSSVVARIWAVFVLFVAVRYYQQSLVNCVEEEAAEDTWQEHVVAGGGDRRRTGPTLVELKKEKKGS